MEEAITQLLSGVAGGRRFWVRAPQSAQRPFIVLNRVSGVRDYHFRGPSGFVQSRVQADVYADSYTAAKNTARAVRNALSGHSSGTIQLIQLDNERDLPASDAGEATHLFRTSLDLTISHQE